MLELEILLKLKKSTIGDNTKVSHFTYIGDAEVGENVILDVEL